MDILYICRLAKTAMNIRDVFYKMLKPRTNIVPSFNSPVLSKPLTNVRRKKILLSHEGEHKHRQYCKAGYHEQIPHWHFSKIRLRALNQRRSMISGPAHKHWDKSNSYPVCGRAHTVDDRGPTASSVRNKAVPNVQHYSTFEATRLII